jgi:hypothetical protein
MADDSTLDSTIVPDEDSTGGGTAGGSSSQPNFLEGVTNALGLIAGVAALGAAVNQIEDVFNSNSAPGGFPVPDLANNGSFRMGIQNAAGGMFGFGSMIGTVPPSPAAELADANITSGSWQALDFNLNRTLGMDWQVKNSDPGNPNILEAYRFAGRAFTRDGGTGQYSWAAAFATWVLVKSGFEGLRTMSPMAFRKFGNNVDFHRGPLTAVRKWDIIVFTSSSNIQHVGFVQGYNRSTQTLQILGGDQAERVKVSNMPYSVTDPLFRVTHVRRNWTLPAEFDVPLWELSAGTSTGQRARPTRPGQETSGPRSTSTTPTFNADGTVAGPGQAARPGPRPAPQTRAQQVDARAGGAAASGGTLT